MTTFSHISSAALGSLLLVNVLPSESGLIVVALVAGGILDVDHLYYLIRDRKLFQKNGYRGNLHKARSLMHEMFGVMVIAYLCMVLNLYYQKLASVVFLAFMIHIVQDMVVGISVPFLLVDKTEVRFFRFSIKGKLVLDIGVIILSIILWTMYLKGFVL